MYKEWAQSHIQRHRKMLEDAKQGHVDAVQQRIDDVQQLGSVIDVTKGLFEVSKVGWRMSYGPPKGMLTRD